MKPIGIAYPILVSNASFENYKLASLGGMGTGARNAQYRYMHVYNTCNKNSHHHGLNKVTSLCRLSNYAFSIWQLLGIVLVDQLMQQFGF